MKKIYPNSGGLFVNKKNQAASPDYTGELTVNADLLKTCPRDEQGNVVIRLAAWEKEGSKGPFFSLKASAPQPKKEPWE
jgi:hypothetical protein